MKDLKNQFSIEELEDRLELGGWGTADGGDANGCCNNGSGCDGDSQGGQGGTGGTGGSIDIEIPQF